MCWIGLCTIWIHQKWFQVIQEMAYSIYASIEDIVNHFKMVKIISGYYHPKYPKHVIVAYCQADKMLGLVALRADIGVDKQYKSGMYFCRFTEAVALATFQDIKLIKT